MLPHRLKVMPISLTLANLKRKVKVYEQNLLVELRVLDSTVWVKTMETSLSFFRNLKKFKAQ